MKNHSMELVHMSQELDIKKLQLEDQLHYSEMKQHQKLNLQQLKVHQQPLLLLLLQHQLPQSTNTIQKQFITKNHSMESVLTKLELDTKILEMVNQPQFIQQLELN
jgi:hypothetical protein